MSLPAILECTHHLTACLAHPTERDDGGLEQPVVKRVNKNSQVPIGYDQPDRDAAAAECEESTHLPTPLVANLYRSTPAREGQGTEWPRGFPSASTEEICAADRSLPGTWAHIADPVTSLAAGLMQRFRDCSLFQSQVSAASGCAGSFRKATSTASHRPHWIISVTRSVPLTPRNWG